MFKLASRNGMRLLITAYLGAAAGNGWAGGSAPSSDSSQEAALAEEANGDTISYSAPGGRALEEVIVTATKRAQNLREVPASIAYIAGEDLERAAAQGIEDIVKLIPGVQFANDDLNGSRVTTRGIAADGPTSATTGVLFGDLSFSDAYVPFVFLNPHPFDLERVEVLKGPQGTLFGASALNGAVRYVPQRAMIGEWETRYFAQVSEVEAGEESGYESGIALNAPIGRENHLAVRLVGIQRRIPGYVDNLHPDVMKHDANAGKQTHIRALLTWQPTDAWDIGLTYGWQKTHIDDTMATDNDEGRLSSGNRPSLQPNTAEYHLANLTMTYTFDSLGQLVSDTGYVLKDGLRAIDASSVFSDRPPRTLQSGAFDAHSATLSQELRWVSLDDDSPWSYVAGLFAWKQQIRNSQYILLAEGLLSLPDILPEIFLPITGPLVDSSGNIIYATLDFDVDVTERAAFGEVTRAFGDNWKLTLGGRFYRTSSGGISALGGLAALASLPSRAPVIDRTAKEKGFSPKVSVVFEPTPELMSYVTVSRGFRVGGVQPGVSVVQDPQVPIPEVFKSDTIWSYEAGVRTAWFDNTLHLDIAGYYLEWEDPQLAQPSSAGEGSVHVTNAAGVKGKGLEFSVQYLAPFGLLFASTISVSRTETTEPFRAPNGEDVPVGTRWLLAPEKQVATKVEWPLNFGQWTVSPAVTHIYIGEAPYSFLFEGDVFGHQQWDAQVSVHTDSIAWMPEISLVGTNLADERAKSGIVRAGTPSGGDFVNYIQPRTLMLRISGRF